MDKAEGPRRALEAAGQVPDVELDIAGVALQFARIDAPDADWHAAEAHLSALAREAVEAASGLHAHDAASRAGLIGRLLARHGYAGDTETYHSLSNANLIHVIHRRRGLPVALGILWLHCARAIGWGAHGLDFPGHFLLALEGRPAKGRVQPGPHQAVLDVFSGGLRLAEPDLRHLIKRMTGRHAELRPGVLAPMSARRVLLRLQENIRMRRSAAGDIQGALTCTHDMLRIANDTAHLWRDAAQMHQQLGELDAALACYDKVLGLVPEGETAAHAREAMDRLRSRLN